MSFWQVKEANSENILLQLEKLFQMFKNHAEMIPFLRRNSKLGMGNNLNF